jgi:thiol-disulfide isomerase/thioredoxin
MSEGHDSTTAATTGRRRRWLAYAAEAALVVLLLVGVHLWQTRDLPSGVVLPLDGALLDGGTVSLRAFRGQPVLVHFWATWCPVCKMEQESINAIARDHTVISIAMQSGSAADVAAHLARNRLVFPVVNDPDGIIAQRWNIRGVPTSFIIDAEGGIRFVEAGYTTEAGLRLRLMLADRDRQKYVSQKVQASVP